jgi:hypothetical protein
LLRIQRNLKAPPRASFDLDQPDAYRCRIHEATITAISHGVGEGQIAVSGMLLRVSTIGSAKTCPAAISIPEDFDPSQLRLGMPGIATVFAENAGIIDRLMSILVGITRTPRI